jgi:hypothetical protein
MMLSIHGTRGRIIEAYMCPTLLRLKIHYSELFDFRDLTQSWLDIFVRWFLSEPLAEPVLKSTLNEPELHKEDSDATDESVADTSETDESSESDISSPEDTIAPPPPPQKPAPIES